MKPIKVEETPTIETPQKEELIIDAPKADEIVIEAPNKEETNVIIDDIDSALFAPIDGSNEYDKLSTKERYNR